MSRVLVCALALLLSLASASCRQSFDPGGNRAREAQRAEAVRIALDDIVALGEEIEGNNIAVLDQDWRTRWAEAWSIVFRNSDGKLHEAATWCLAFVDTLALSDLYRCTALIEEHKASQ